MAYQVPTSIPQYGVLVLADNPYILLNVIADGAHKIRIKYLSSNTGKQPDGTIVSEIGQLGDTPLIPREYHNILVTLVTMLISEELASQVDSGSNKPKHPTMAKAAKDFRERYEYQLIKAKRDARRTYITPLRGAFQFVNTEMILKRTGY